MLLGGGLAASHPLVGSLSVLKFPASHVTASQLLTSILALFNAVEQDVQVPPVTTGQPLSNRFPDLDAVAKSLLTKTLRFEEEEEATLLSSPSTKFLRLRRSSRRDS